MGNWVKVKISDIGEVVGGATPSTKNEQYYNGDISWITPKDLSDFKGRFISRGERNITQQGLESCSTRLLPKNTILFSSRAPIGYVAIADKIMCTNQGFKSVIPNENVDYMFLYYLLKYNKDRIEAMGSGTTFKEVSGSTMRNIEVVIPNSISEQKKIANILDAIDSKIENNQEININLQKQSQTIFSKWLATHLSTANEVTLGDICLKVTDGSHFSPKDVPLATIPMLSVKDMQEFDFDFTGCKHISDEDYEKMIANDCVPQVDDILVAKDGSYLKEIFICNEQRKIAILSSIAIFRADCSKIFPEILLAFLKSPRVLQEVRDNYVSGSALPRIVLKDFKKFHFLLPDINAQYEISPLLSSIRTRLAVNVAENQRLQQLRDNLLPKLMSHEIDVSSVNLGN